MSRSRSAPLRVDRHDCGFGFAAGAGNDIGKSGTRKAEFLVEKLKSTMSNADFLDSMNQWSGAGYRRPAARSDEISKLVSASDDDHLLPLLNHGMKALGIDVPPWGGPLGVEMFGAQS